MDIASQLFEKRNISSPFFLLAGPCVVENKKMVEQIATTLKTICEELHIPLVFKASYKKANRSSISSFTGIGDEAALDILAQVRTTFQIPVVTDIHTEPEAELAAKYVDILQIPAFLCRQTSLLQAAAQTGKIVNIKKGQFMSAESMRHAVDKVVAMGNGQVMLTERGTSFGYHDLVVDFRSIPVMQTFGKPVIMDCTHALQTPNQVSGVTGGQPQYIETIASCALAAGADGLFIETHPNPSQALSDGANMLPLHQIKPLLEKMIRIKRAVL